MRTAGIFLLFIILIGIYSCASTGTLTGGPKDVTPPMLDSVRSSPFFQTNYLPKELHFFFDEFIEVRDAQRQVLISPPTTYIPKISHRGKKLSFVFDEKEVLRQDATYSINFGESVVDFTEGNKVDNFIYVFATGEVIDSLSLSGKVLDAITGKPEEGIFVFLYDNLTDSVVQKEKPFYFVKTDRSGDFRFTNIRSDSFRIFVLKDENVNYLYDLPNEKMAFHDEQIHISDSTSLEIVMHASVSDILPVLRSTLSRDYGKAALVYSSKPDTITWSVNPSIEHIYSDVKGDSLLLYYDTQVDSFFIETSRDTVKIKPKDREKWIAGSTLKVSSTNISRNMSPADSISIDFNSPVLSLDETLIYITDSIGIPDNVSLRLSENRKKLTINADWRPSNAYFITLDSGSVTDIYRHALDSIEFIAGFAGKDQLAGINLKLSGLDTSTTYVLNMKIGDKPVFSVSLENISMYEQAINLLLPEKYTFEIIEDKNRNGKWDPGNYWLKRQPEKILISETERLRANWDSDVLIIWNTEDTETELQGEKNSLDDKG